MLLLLDSFLMPVLTSTIFVLLVYLIFKAKKVLEDAKVKNKALPNVERLKQSLPLTVSTSWKIGDVVNGVPIWENHVFSSETDNGVIASQALLQASAEVVVKELTHPRMLQLVHPWISDTSLAPGSPIKQTEESEIKSDVLLLECKVPYIKAISTCYFKLKNSCSVRRRWKCGKDNVCWLVMAPEYKVYEDLFGAWQCCMAIDIPNEGKEPNMCLLSIFAAPPSEEKSSLQSLGSAIASQIISIREHVDSLYLKRILRKDLPKRKTTIEQRAKSTNDDTATNNSKILMENRTPAKSFAGREERGYVESPAEIKEVSAFQQSTPMRKEEKTKKVEDKDLAVVNEKLAIYKDTLEEAFEMVLRIYDADETTAGWAYLGNRNGIEIYRMAGDASCPSDCFKGTVVANVPISFALQYLTNIEFKKEWDDIFNEGKIIEDIDLVTKVTYMDYKPVWPTTARDFCSITATRHVKGDTYAIAVKATAHPSCPPVKGKQRAEIITGGFVVEGISADPPQCKVTYITRADLKGKLPASLTNKANEKQPLFTGIIRDKMEERFAYQDPPDEGDVKIIAARRYPSLRETEPTRNDSQKSFAEDIVESKPELMDSELQKTEDDGFTLKCDRNGSEKSMNEEAVEAGGYRELSKTEIDTFIPENDVKWETMSETSVTSLDRMEEYQETNDMNGDVKPLAEQNLELPRDHYGNLDLKTLGNQTAAKLLEEIFLASKVNSTSKVPETADQTGEWTYQGTFKNVVVLRKIHSDSNFYSFLGRGVMDVLPVTVWEAVKNPSSRFVYDNMLKKTSVVKELGDGLKVLHMRHETTACFVKQARDFVILTCERVDPGKYVIAGTSIDIPECPLERNCIRGRVLASGWIIEPVLNKGKPCSLVTYLSQVDFGGKLPIRLINLIAKRQPMSIAYLRSYLEAAEQRN